jgi:FkbM family methyltransferase
MSSAGIAVGLSRTLPIRGRGRALMLGARVLPSWREHVVTLVDGRRLCVDLGSVACMSYVLTGDIHEEAGESAFARTVVRPGDVCVDIGANVGWYMTMMAEGVGPSGKVWAVEPHPNMARLLRRSAQRYPQVEVLEQALSDVEGMAELHPGYDEGQSTLGDAPSTTTVPVRVSTLDAAVPPGVAFVKCDAEGAELAIVRGAAGHLAGPRPPMWLLEWGPSTSAYFGGYRAGDLVDAFGSGYRASLVDSHDGRLRELPETSGRFNLALVPPWMEERVAHLRV